MDVLYITQKLQKLEKGQGLYTDLICTLKDRGHNIDIIAAGADKTFKEIINGINIMHIDAGNQFNVNYIKKGIVFLRIKPKIIRAVKKYYKDKSFDLILYEAPPVTFADVIRYCKKKFKCKTYLMQKDIFPQNALDLGILKKTGIKGLIYRYFKRKEKKLYAISDKIGCMSQGNIDFLAEHNGVNIDKLELFPNAVIPLNNFVTDNEKGEIRRQYNLSENKIYFIYGGNLGKPQGTGFLITAIGQLQCYEKAAFIFVGRGTEKDKIKACAKELNNLIYLEEIPPEQYIKLVSCCNVGIISLDCRFTIPNYPSRVLSYMEASLPVLACTDNNTDFKELITEQAKCGVWSCSNDIEAFKQNVLYLCGNTEERVKMGISGRKYMEENFNTDICAEKLEKFMEIKNV